MPECIVLLGGYLLLCPFLPAGRVDAVVQSTDKNFMVPVGGAIVAAGKRLPDLVEAVNKLYPGRAAVNAHLDLLMTLLHWGAQGWKQVGTGGAGAPCHY